nr:hypothetical protein [Tanacetum cinerariifolium]
IAPVTIIDHQLPFEYNIASRTTGVMVELRSMFKKQARVDRFELIQTFHACKQEEEKPVGPYVIKMKNCVAQLERLGYVLPQDISVGLILNGLTSDFAGFVRNYNKHKMGKTISQLHALLIKYDKGLSKKAATPQVMAIQGGRYQKANKKSLNAKGKGKGKGKGKDKSYIPKPKNPKPSAKEHPTQQDTCHHCKEAGHCKRNFHAYLAELIKKKKQVGTARSLDIFDYALETATRVLNMVPTKKVDKTPYELCGRAVDNKEIQDEDISPSKNTSKILIEVEGFEPPQEELIPVLRNPEAELRVNYYCNAGFETDKDEIKYQT